MRNSAGGLVLLGAGVMVLLMFFTGRLEWLFALGRDVNTARTGAASDGGFAGGTGGGGSWGTPTGPTATARKPPAPPLRGVAA